VETADGWISFTINTNKQVIAFLKATGREALIEDPRFNSVAARANNVRDWFAVRGAPLRQHTTAQWLQIFNAADIASKPCHTLESLQKDPHLTHVGMLVDDDHPSEGRTLALRSSLRVDDTSLPLPSFSQPKGWASRQILADLGFDEAAIDQLIRDGAVLAHA
jgi:crotonobetainyl-CoA:carnitine CoA-transferase CaiB-like acyl-CoA transferase